MVNLAEKKGGKREVHISLSPRQLQNQLGGKREEGSNTYHWSTATLTGRETPRKREKKKKREGKTPFVDPLMFP